MSRCRGSVQHPSTAWPQASPKPRVRSSRPWRVVSNYQSQRLLLACARVCSHAREGVGDGGAPPDTVPPRVSSGPDDCLCGRLGRIHTFPARQTGEETECESLARAELASGGNAVGGQAPLSQVALGLGGWHPASRSSLRHSKENAPTGAPERGWDSPPPRAPGHRAAVAVRPGPEPRQGGLHPGQLPQDAAHGPHHHARHDQPRTIPRYARRGRLGRGCRGPGLLPSGPAALTGRRGKARAVSRPRGEGRRVVPAVIKGTDVEVA